MNRLIRFTIIMAATLLTAASLHAEPDQVTQTIFKTLMEATVSNNYDAFIAECDAPMKAAMTKPILEGASKQIEPRAKQGYEAQYFGEVKKQGYQVHIWRLQFKDGGDDIVATLSVKDGKAGGFFLK